ncbi:hypothetical protein HPC49_38980 [Pyxidicoccus fallax]|uniref:Immunity MXAN-0049 protein domain-containing protein n=1 Tax=Pyxidicoccus fallax TaxID=394095 RepID=A0A848LSF8_9BACT|nr:DUF1629 domain-containing protein [Pyxidicoccus fallax]NMO20599.1 hypothetical protein [Pyxidicoccus fallax]NPC84184.1 hypothetical protein [Pyxidicoccus fallax]
MQTDYYVIECAPNNSHPLLDIDEVVGLGRPAPLVISQPLQLRLGAPVPRNPVMVDHHALPQPVFSSRIVEALEPLGLYCVQFVPADVKVKQDDVRRYWVLHVYNEIPCVDRQRSVLSIDDEDGRVMGIDALVLDERVLERIPLERRLLFVLEESISTYLFHSSVVERVLALAPPPEGLRFIRVDRWNDSAGFQAGPPAERS